MVQQQRQTKSHQLLLPAATIQLQQGQQHRASTHHQLGLQQRSRPQASG
jgi:hypothetical protein